MLKMQGLAGHLTLLLFLLFIHPCNGDTGGQTVMVFKGGKTDVSYNEDNDNVEAKRKPNAFRVPAFVGGVLNNTEVLSVLCNAQFDQSAESPFIEPVVRTSNGNYQTWSDAVIFGKNTETYKGKKVMGNITAVMKEDKIYALVTIFNTLQDLLTVRDAITTEWDTVMLVGTVVKSTDSNSGGGYTVKWEKEISLKELLPKPFRHYHPVFFCGGVGNGMVMKNGTIVLPVQIINKIKDGLRHQASSIIYSSNNGTTWHMGRLTPELPTSEGSVVEWSKGKLLLSVRLDLGYRVVYESNNMGVTWDEFSPFTRVWGNNPNDKNLGSQGSAITVPVNGKNILLVSHPVNTEDNENRETLQLWVGDGKRISCVGTISEDDKGEQTGNSILAHIGDKLYVTHEINPFGKLRKTVNDPGARDKVIAISLLQDFFDSAKNTVSEWQQLDRQFQSKGIPADGLVGFLGNTIKGSSVWQDMYNCVNATVKNAISVKEGFRFNGSPGSYALWPVQNQGQNQVYKFTDNQFTLAATVIIHNTRGDGEVSVFGVGEGMHTNGILVGLGYTKSKEWITTHGSDVKWNTDVLFQLEKEYHITIVFNEDTDFVYVNGEEITSGEQIRAKSQSSVDFFYMGGTGNKSAKEGSSCTVKNVMLFNRALDDHEITKLSKVKIYGNTNKPPSIAKPIGSRETHKTVSTIKPINVPNIQGTVSKEEPVRLLDTKEPVLTRKLTGLWETQKITSTTTPLHLPNIQKRVSTTDLTHLPNNDKNVLTTDAINLSDTKETVETTVPTNMPDTEKAMLTTEPNILPNIQKTVLKTDPTGLKYNVKKVITTEPTSLSENSKRVSPTESQETDVNKKEGTNDASEKGKSVNLFQHVYRNTTIEEQMNLADDATVPYFFVNIMCFICSIIVLTGV